MSRLIFRRTGNRRQWIQVKTASELFEQIQIAKENVKDNLKTTYYC